MRQMAKHFRVGAAIPVDAEGRVACGRSMPDHLTTQDWARVTCEGCRRAGLRLCKEKAHMGQRVSEIRWTPGPWEAVQETVTHPAAVKADKTELPFVHVFGPNHAERAATARLIAAAPDLYEALFGATQALRAIGAPDAARPFEAALTRARGA